jgi:hypothetical protein
MFDKVKWVQFKNYSGVSIKGTTPFNLPAYANHWDRVVWLTSIVESGGKFGTVISYDGTGATAGLCQMIAVYPKELADEDGNPENDQGSLWRQIERIRKADPSTVTELLTSLKNGKGWDLVNGKVVGQDGKTLNGRVLREELTPNQGRVPRKGPDWEQAKCWGMVFHNLFSNPNTFETQVSFSIEHAKETARRKTPLLHGVPISETIYKDNPDQVDDFIIGTPLDLAMAVFFSNSVNAPAAAYRRFTQALDAHRISLGHPLDLTKPVERLRFAARLIRVLGTAQFARWNAEIPGGRYQRTRSTAQEIWPPEFFTGPNAIMPKKF